jgi:hypothetical protein
MAYQIVIQSPRYCPITDGIIGSQFQRLPNAYETLVCARAIASRLATEDYEAGGDDSYRVITWGGDILRDVVLGDRVCRAVDDDTIPF